MINISCEHFRQFYEMPVDSSEGLGKASKFYMIFFAFDSIVSPDHSLIYRHHNSLENNIKDNTKCIKYTR